MTGRAQRRHMPGTLWLIFIKFMDKLVACANNLKELFDPYFYIEIENWKKFTNHGEIIKVKKNTTLKKAHTSEKYLYFILSGSGGIFKWNNNNFFCFALAYEKDFFGDYVSFLNQEQSELEVLVFEDSELFRIYYDNFLKMVKSDRGEKIRRFVAEAIINYQQERQKDLLTKTAIERYDDLIKKQPDILKRTPQKYIASYLGITPQSLSRIRKKVK